MPLHDLPPFYEVVAAGVVTVVVAFALAIQRYFSKKRQGD